MAFWFQGLSLEETAEQERRKVRELIEAGDIRTALYLVYTDRLSCPGLSPTADDIEQGYQAGVPLLDLIA